MSSGAEVAVAHPDEAIQWEEPAESGWAEEHFALPDVGAPEPEPESGGKPLLAGALIILALGWIGLCGLAFYRTFAGAPPLVDIAGWVATMSVPLVLLGLAWLIFGRSSRSETEKFTRAVVALRSEAQTLDRVLGVIAERLVDNRAQLTESSARLMRLGEEASDRLGRVTHYLARESTELERKSSALEAAAAQARVDMGVLLADIPQAEQAARTFSETLKEAGVTANERARALEAQLSAITARAQDADTNVGGAAERLSAHISRIESSAGVASEQLEGTAARLDAAVDAALARTTEAVEATRGALDVQAQALAASIEESRARFAEAGAEVSRQIGEQLGTLTGQVETIEARLAAQDESVRALLASVANEIDQLDERLRLTGAVGHEQSARLSQSVEALRGLVGSLYGEIGRSREAAGDMIDQAHNVGAAMDSVAARMREELSPALDDVQAKAATAQHTALSAVEPVAEAQAAAQGVLARLIEAEHAIERQKALLQDLVLAGTAGAERVEEKLKGIASAASEAEEASSIVLRETGPELVEALVRVREAARAAAQHAREAISAVIPESAASLSDAVKGAVDQSVTDEVKRQIAELEAASQHATAIGRNASERLTRQILSLGESAAALEARIEEERVLREEQEQNSMGRSVALLIESLNSTAIDVTKILSNEVTDTAWRDYLKGERGVFTRRAVRLLETGEAREIARHYDEEPEFRDQVNRYIHDFEAMLRRVLADREGDALSITLLSSDMGKLYVALAQAIERLRR